MSSRERMAMSGRIQPVFIRSSLVAVLTVLVVALGFPAQATNLGAYSADDSHHTWARVNMTSNGAEAMNWGIGKIGATQMSTEYLSCGTGVDACGYDGSYESSGAGGESASWWNTHLGLARCFQSVSSTRCGEWNVYFDTADIPNLSLARRRSLGCHELGHTVGLEHRNGGCMQNPISTNLSYSSHSLGHVNGRY